MTTAAAFDMARFMKEFLEFEVEEDLFAVSVRGQAFWDYVRYSVFYECVFSHFGRPSYRRSLRSSDYLREAPNCIRAFGRESLSQKRPYDIIVINYDRSQVIDGRQRNIHMYPFIKELSGDYRILLIERSLLRLIDEKAYPCAILRFRPFYLIDRTRSRLWRFTADEVATFERIAERIQDSFRVRVDMLRLARDIFAFQLETRRRYLDIFRKYTPRAVVYADDAAKKGVITAAREQSVATIDLQHSLMSALNILYTYPDVPAIHERSIRSDYIFTYGEFWHPQYRLPVNLIPVGWPYLERQLDRVSPFGEERSKSIIVIGQRISREVVVNAALEVARLLPDHTIYYKLRIEEYHDWRAHYPEALRTTRNIVVIDSDERSLIEWFSRCQYQIGINSTALCEGLACGLTTFILQQEWYGEMTALVESGYVLLVSSAQEIANGIRAGVRAPRTGSRDVLFKRHSSENIRKAVEMVLCESGGTSSQREMWG